MWRERSARVRRLCDQVGWRLSEEGRALGCLLAALAAGPRLVPVRIRVLR